MCRAQQLKVQLQKYALFLQEHGTCLRIFEIFATIRIFKGNKRTHTPMEQKKKAEEIYVCEDIETIHNKNNR